MREEDAGSARVPIEELLRNYRTSHGGYDELLTPRGTVRPVWEQLAAGLSRLGPTGIAQRAEHARRLLRENGVTYNVVGAPQGPNRPWELDPLPLLFPASEWQVLAAGLSQRAALLNALLADLYGPQRTLLAGILPAAVVLGNPLFSLACRNIHPLGGQHLILHGCNLARQPDGSWFVLADRTQGPSGAGYALENRINISRTLPHDFESLHIERLAGFFNNLREKLRGLAPEHCDNPRVVLLSPGPKSSRYFEDGYLARYLGYSLVEGGDLTVRGERVFLKTLGGLLPVDVILRRILDGDWDPLELRPDSTVGSPGLLQTIRGKQLAVANGIGSGVLESPVFQAYLPALCRLLLGEELRLPCQPTWWCGDAEGMRLLAAEFPNLLLRKAFVHRNASVVDGRTLSESEQAGWLERVRAQPSQYVVQQPLRRSYAPTWSANGIVPAAVVLRTFAVADADGYQILPGGLCRVSLGANSLNESASDGQSSKDVWVISDQPVKPITLLPTSTSAVELRRSTNDVPSRVADHMFWLGRYAERAEALTRHLRSCVVRITNELEPANGKELRCLVAALEESSGDSQGGTVEEVELSTWTQEKLMTLIFREQHPGTLAQLLASLQRTATQVRDRLSLDGWRIVNQLELDLLYPWKEQQPRWGEVLLLLNQVLNLLAAFSGVGTESMTRGPGWRFLDMGRRIERALQILTLVRRTLVIPLKYSTPVLEAVLEIADSSMTYRHRYLASLQLAPLLDLVLIDETNPRAVGFQFNALSEHVDSLPTETAQPQRTIEQRIMLGMQATLRLTDVDGLAQVTSSGRRDSLENFILALEDQLRQLSTSLNHHYLAHTAPTHQLGTARSAGRFDS